MNNAVPLITVDGVDYTAEQVRQRLRYFQAMARIASEQQHMTVFRNELFRRIPDVKDVELRGWKEA